MTAPALTGEGWAGSRWCSGCWGAHRRPNAFCGCDCHRVEDMLAELAALVSGAGWRDLAACRGADPRIFFPEPLTATAAGRSRAAEAIGYCTGCPVRTECLADALASGADEGVWAGLVPEERRTLGATAGRRLALCGAGLHLNDPPGKCPGCARDAERERSRRRPAPDYAAVYARRLARAKENAA